jgi:hypothetical protein
MAIQTPAPARWQLDDSRNESLRPAEGWGERLASWLVVYLAALMSCLALVGSAWAAGLIR